MKCPKCSYVSFDFLDACRKCRVDLVDFKAQFGLSGLKPGDLDLSIVLQDDLRSFIQPAEGILEEQSDVMTAEKSFEGPPSEGYMTVMLDISDTETQSIAGSASPESPRASWNSPADDTESESAEAPPRQGADRSPKAGGEQRGAMDFDDSIELPTDTEFSDDSSEVPAEQDSTIDMLSGAELSILEEQDESKQQSKESVELGDSTDALELSPDQSAIDLSGLRAQPQEREPPAAKSPETNGKPTGASDQSAIDLSGLRAQPQEREPPAAKSPETNGKPTGKDDATASRPPQEGYVTIEMDVDDIQEDDRQERRTTAKDSHSGRDSRDASHADSFEAALDMENDDVDEEEESFLIDLETLDSENGEGGQTKNSSS
jgi:hypothetical protein